jgi:uncharacterized membrane protein YhhN
MIVVFFLIAIAAYYYDPSAWAKAIPVLFLYIFTQPHIRKYPVYKLFLFAAIGDALIYYDYISRWFLLTGMLSFAISHLYLIKYLRLNIKVVSPMILIPNILLPLISLSLGFLYPILSYMVIPIVIYSLIISYLILHVLVYYGHNNNKILIACFLFVLSDILILIELIIPEFPHCALPIYWLSMYILAYTLIN